MSSIENDHLHAALCCGATELTVAVPFLRRVLRWVALLPDGVRHELLRREVALERQRVASVTTSPAA